MNMFEVYRSCPGSVMLQTIWWTHGQRACSDWPGALSTVCIRGLSCSSHSLLLVKIENILAQTAQHYFKIFNSVMNNQINLWSLFKHILNVIRMSIRLETRTLVCMCCVNTKRYLSKPWTVLIALVILRDNLLCAGRTQVLWSVASWFFTNP